MTLTKLLRTSAAALGALAVASVTQANAADIYSGGGMKDVPAYIPPPTWAGFYIGANAGVDWAQRNQGQYNYWDGWDGYGGSLNGNNLNSQGGLIGGQFGFNWQGGPWVYGIEVDLDYITMNGRGNSYGYVGGYVDGIGLNEKQDGGFGGDVTGRLGYTWGSTLLYVKGGFAFLNANHNMNETIYWGGGGSTSYNGNNNDNWVTGYTVGGGIEWKVSPSWSVKAEYLYYDFSNNNNNCCGDGWNYWHNNNDLTASAVKIGFNYFWNPPAAPLK